jgi:hypothetical protein
MSHLLVHDMDTPWTSSAAALAVTVEPTGVPGIPGASNRLAASGAAVATATTTFGAGGLDLSGFDELRFWIIADRRADGSSNAPFYLELFYIDLGNPAVEFRWFVSVNASGRWEQRAVGLGANPRSAVGTIGFRALQPIAFACAIDELLAVREEMMRDAEGALTIAIERDVTIAGLSVIPTLGTPAAGDTQLVLGLTPGFVAGNRIGVTGGSLGEERFDLVLVTDDSVAGTTTLDLAGGQVIAGTYGGPASVSVVLPAVVETSQQPTVAPEPSVVVTMLDAREDLDRTVYFDQRDSFRALGAVTVCTVRPAPRAFLIDYQLTVTSPRRNEQLFVHELLLQRLSAVSGLRINGTIAPLWLLPPPPQFVRRLGELSPIYLRIGTHMQLSPRQEQTWVQHAEVRAAPYDAHGDWERVEVNL